MPRPYSFRHSIATLLLFVMAACATPTPLPVETHTLPSDAVSQPHDSTPPHIIIEHGNASFYADKLDGRPTASGKPMDQNALTAASEDLPLGTKVTVTNLDTGKSVDVEVNDRGPYVPDRIIDLSKRAATELDMRKGGVAPVKVKARPADQPTHDLQKKVEKIAVAKSAVAMHKKKKQQAFQESAPADR